MVCGAVMLGERTMVAGALRHWLNQKLSAAWNKWKAEAAELKHRCKLWARNPSFKK